MTSKTADIQFIDESGGGPVLRLRKPPQQQKRQEPAATFLRNEPNFSNEAKPALVPTWSSPASSSLTRMAEAPEFADGSAEGRPRD